jgi:hypothetical protein
MQASSKLGKVKCRQGQAWAGSSVFKVKCRQGKMLEG